MVIQEPWSSRNIFRRRYRPKGSTTRTLLSVTVQTAWQPANMWQPEWRWKVNKLVTQINTILLCQAHALWAMKLRLKTTLRCHFQHPEVIDFSWPISTVTISSQSQQTAWNKMCIEQKYSTYISFHASASSGACSDACFVSWHEFCLIRKIIQTFVTCGVFFFHTVLAWNQIMEKYLSGRAWDWFGYPAFCTEYIITQLVLQWLHSAGDSNIYYNTVRLLLYGFISLIPVLTFFSWSEWNEKPLHKCNIHLKM